MIARAVIGLSLSLMALAGVSSASAQDQGTSVNVQGPGSTPTASPTGLIPSTQPGGSTTGGDSSLLPRTGRDIALFAGIATALIGTGAAMIILARRRREARLRWSVPPGC